MPQMKLLQAIEDQTATPKLTKIPRCACREVNIWINAKVNIGIRQYPSELIVAYKDRIYFLIKLVLPVTYS